MVGAFMVRLKKSGIRLITCTALALFAVLLLSLFPAQSASLISELTLYSVKSYFPAYSAKEEAAKAVAATVTEKKAAESTEKQEKTNSAELTETDEDIKKLMKEAEKATAKEKKGGAITDYTFTTDGVTDSFENVRVKNTNKTKISIEQKLEEKLELTVNKNEPAVLIYHTHTTETYQLLDRDFFAKDFASRSNDSGKNMVRVGKAICDELEKRGYKVIHDTTVYDKTYSGAYYRSEDAARALLEKYPSIKITLDIHRDAIQSGSTKTRPVAEINGKKAAQIMIVTGCQEEGNGITDLPEWEKNLAFALKLQQNMESSFKGLTRPVFFCDRSYNMGLTPLSLLVEVGTDANTLEQAVYSGKMFGVALAQLLEEYEEK
ncbi:MAG: hypothetical protein E7538_07365 [Ruminococcaceae bacterium]|nr:hypothetical protein [Oscillospiraceae bacterium]